MITKNVPILIVGGGGAGLSSSLLLSKHGVESLLVSGLPTTSTLPKAHVLGQRTMEIFTEVGVAEEVYRRGTPLENMAATGFYAGVQGSNPNSGREIGKLQLWGNGYTDPEYIDASPWAVANLPQLRLEPILKAHAEELNPGGVLFNHELITIEQDEDGVTSTILDKATGEEYQVRSRYVIAADGGRTVGGLVGITLDGQRNILDMVTVHMSADLSGVLGDESVMLRWLTNPDFGGTFTGGVLNPMGPDLWGTRSTEWVFSIGYPNGAPDTNDREKVVEQMKTLLGMPDLQPEIHTISVWTMEAVVADRFRSGRVFVVGDAAHKHPPTSGLGLNSAVHDAQNLCWKLARVLSGHAGETLLDTYEAERKPVVLKNIANSVRCTEDSFALDAVLGLSPEKSPEDNWAAIEAIWDPEHPDFEERNRQVNNALAAKSREFRHHGLEYGFTYDSAAVVADGSAAPEPIDEIRVYEPSTRPGHPLPHAFVSRRGEVFPLHDLTYGCRFVLLAGEDGHDWVEAARQIADQTGLPLEAYTVGADDAELADVRLAWLRKREISRRGAVLVRPDRFVGYRSIGGVDSPKQSLTEALGALLSSDLSFHGEAAML
ncbi:2,4-dichlorophenol 6-monooxygenase [Arthrobacter sp. SLBN-100]|uniref:FAD-dependent monooxygenase n=1 Tax=Arthrobacter sp. SLBN-100 TaxID=2768450 RepID=UPI0011538CE3|nr:FAD-dependent monooxygenase [Arthrobacter sp. SLBN-100]TQJ62086.1 2,4-dichlorophenol 6-monooxygenase [Arthrobacter sp. SLBN-100]